LFFSFRAILYCRTSFSEIRFQNKTFDIIWAEGAVFIIGIKEGLKQWKNLLKKEGFLVLTDLVWIRDERPDELTKYWEQEGLALLSIEQVLEYAAKEGYELIRHFTLPDEGWLKEYILPQEEVLTSLKVKYASIKEAQDTFTAIEYENKIVKKYIGYFGYEFFIWKYKDAQ